MPIPHRSASLRSSLLPEPPAAANFDPANLDPASPADWEQFRLLAHQALDEAISFVRDVRNRPVWQPVPLPVQSTALGEVYEDFRANILPYATGNIHPRFFGWVHGSGQPGSLIADLMASAMNSNCGGRDHGAIYVERAVLNWCKQLVGFPAEASGLLVSGTSMANLVAVNVALHHAAPDIRRQGLLAHPRQLVAYASSEAHSSVGRALEVLGLGSANLRRIPVTDQFQINLDLLQRAIAADRALGLEPFCIVGCAATVNTAAIDDLQALAQIARCENLWFHVDGAFGALLCLSDQLRSRLAGIEQADSVAFDFHKWAHVQYDAACVLVRRPGAQRDTFSMRPVYLEAQEQGLGAGAVWPCDLGPELSRGFRALKVWFALKQHGTEKLGQMIEKNVRQAQYLAARIAADPGMELLAPANLNIVCFRLLAPGMDEAALNVFNKQLVQDVQLAGIAAPSTSRLHGRLAIRVNLTNHRTEDSDLDLLLSALNLAAAKRLGAA